MSPNKSPNKLLLSSLAASLAVAALACDTSTPAQSSQDPAPPGGKADDLESCAPETQTVRLETAFSDLQFQNPVAAIQAPGTDRWYVVEQRGVIWTFTASADAMTASARTVFVDMRSQVNSGPNEAGLLGFALAPDFAASGEVYLSYTRPSANSAANLRSQLTRATSSDGLTLDLNTEQVLLGIDQPFGNHNGGHIAFGPDNMLYMGLGDGGSAGDPSNRAQNLESGFGKLLRVDVSGGGAYSVPDDNPFVGVAGIDEIYAYGLRNPWRFSFDEATDRLWLADVGQNQFEEVDIIVSGGNYGWRIREGAHCFGSPTCQSAGLIDPVAEYPRSEGFSVTGGFVYRGTDIPSLDGQYIFGDFGSGSMWALDETPSGSFDRRLVASTNANIASFARSQNNELFALDFATGEIKKLVGNACDGEPGPDAGPGPSPTSFRDIYANIIVPRCGGCHVLGSRGGLSLPDPSAAFSALIGVDATTAACAGRERVVPGDSASSLIFQKVSGINLCGPRMPFGGPPLSSSDIDAIGEWIDEGAVF